MTQQMEAKETRYVTDKCPVYIKLPFIGRTSYRFERMIKNAVNTCFPSVTTKAIFTSKPNFPNMRKDRLPTHSANNIVYRFECYCDSKYVGQTTQTLRKRMSQHIPACMRDYIEHAKNNNLDNFTRKDKVINATKRSAICEHLFNNNLCMINYNVDRFKPIARARNKFHLSVLESIYITMNSPEICKQSEYVYCALLF